MTDTDIRPTWGYRKGEGGTVERRIFNLEGKDKLPSGWEDTPAKVKKG